MIGLVSSKHSALIMWRKDVARGIIQSLINVEAEVFEY